MSYCEIIGFKDGVPFDSEELRNSHGGGSYVFGKMFNKFLKDPAKPYSCWLTCDASSLWSLYKNKDIPKELRAVHLSMFDYAIVYKKDFSQYIVALAKFVDYFGYQDCVCHLNSFAEWIFRNSEFVDAVGYYGTSVGENLWYNYEGVAYNINTGDEHFDVYKELETSEHD